MIVALWRLWVWLRFLVCGGYVHEIYQNPCLRFVFEKLSLLFAIFPCFQVRELSKRRIKRITRSACNFFWFCLKFQNCDVKVTFYSSLQFLLFKNRFLKWNLLFKKKNQISKDYKSKLKNQSLFSKCHRHRIKRYLQKNWTNLNESEFGKNWTQKNLWRRAQSLQK